ncbi:probable CCR4-associated factor 1 homolog 11 [Zingiber officinale]|uniref:probable CCR4-associated factor 1 homolog 11 n=1 Tax=Zingiber officinale TaxID=94328 RepID=UPI001C4DA9A3|nr:probable CCR4-associated factor 1 homolog 11 [Zingiber officinale]
MIFDPQELESLEEDDDMEDEHFEDDEYVTILFPDKFVIIWGIDSCTFAHHLATSGLLSFGHFSPVSWVTFQGAYDFAFLVKMFTCDCKLPKTIHEFLHLVHFFFGKRVFDVKHLCKHCPGLYGGLERVASTVRVERAVGSRHQSGSDSLLTWQVFYQIAFRVNPQLIHRPEHMGTLFDLQLQ